MKDTLPIITRHIACSLLIFISFLAIYWVSVPNKFNTRYENRTIFDSDGEFIVRQFREGKTYTHNDHLLYHILAKTIFEHSGKLNIAQNYITPHKILSCFFGALGVTFFYIFGALITRRCLLPLICAIFAGGTAGWWFFSATIDTYVPCLSVSIPVLGMAVLSLRQESLSRSAAIGLCAGVAFLFRTDSVLLVLIGIYLLKNRENAVDNALAIIFPGAIVGILGYALLAHLFYNVDLNAGSIFSWARGSLQRPESAGEKIWGTTNNLTFFNAANIFINQLLYTIVLPGLQKTRDPDFLHRYIKGGWIPLLIYLSTFGFAVYHQVRRIIADQRRSNNETMFIAILAGTWFFSRMLFYTWWDPFDPFLFAVMAMPAVWLVILTGFQYAMERTANRNIEIKYWCLLGTMTLAVWLHNIYYLIAPIRKNFC